jgi:hypothetical protein
MVKGEMRNSKKIVIYTKFPQAEEKIEKFKDSINRQRDNISTSSLHTIVRGPMNVAEIFLKKRGDPR